MACDLCIKGHPKKKEHNFSEVSKLQNNNTKTNLGKEYAKENEQMVASMLEELLASLTDK